MYTRAVGTTIHYDAESPRPRFRVRTFGGLSVEGRDAAVPATVNQRKRLVFLALLAAAGPRGIARERMLLMLWPESTTDRARGALYQLLYIVRQAFGEESVVGTDELRLDAKMLESDVFDFNEALARGDLAAAVDLYAGPFLDAVHVPGAPELERWIEQKRQELARGYQSALARLATEAMERRDDTAAIAFAERLVAANPLSGRAAVLLMEALAASGDVSGALERAREHASIVRQELDAEIDADVSALAARLRSDVSVNRAIASETPSVEISQSAERPQGSPDAPPRRRSGAIPWAVAGIVVIGITAAVAMRRPNDRGTEFVVVANFETTATDSQIADMLTENTRRALSASRSLGAVPDVRLVAARQRLRLPPTGRLTVELARQVALGDGIRSIVAGKLASFGGSYAMSLHLVSASSGEVLATADQAGIVPANLFAALDTLTRRLRTEAGDDLQAIRAQPSILALTSSSLEAMTDYVTALRLPRDSMPRAVALLRRAVMLDTSFASALWQLSRLVESTGPTREAEHFDLLARAWRHRDGLTEYERLRVEIAYKYSPDGTNADINEHFEHLRQVVERYPNVVDAKILADYYLGLRDLAAAERAYRLAIALDSTRSDAYLGLISTFLKANRIPDARRAIDDFARRFPGSAVTDAFDALVSYAEGQRDRARVSLRRMAAFPGNTGLGGTVQLATLELLDGRVAAFERAMQAKDSMVGILPRAPGLRSTRLWARYWIVDRPDEGLAMLESAMAADSTLRSSLDAAEYYAQFGQPDSARVLLASRGWKNRSAYVRGCDTLPVSAWIDLAEGRPRDAAAKFRASLRFSGGNAPSQISRDAETGLAFERAALADSAITTYEHYLNAVPVMELDEFRLVWILEHVARLYEAKGDRRKASAAYGRVADLWKDADPDLQPRVRHARERAAALR
jgi:DNA-binding SARP family transcriptional activator